MTKYSELYKQITFVIPSYKNTKTLKRTLNSIVSQPKFQGNILISEDYSDNHFEIERIINKFSEYNIRYIVNKPAKGMTGNWNNCILLSQTPYVVMIHDDDYLYDNYMMVLKKIWDKFDFDILFFNHDLVKYEYETEKIKIVEKEKIDGIKFLYNKYKNGKIKKIKKSDYYFGGLQGKLEPSCGVVYNKQFMMETGGYSKEDGYSVDEIFVEKFCNKGIFVYCDELVAAHTYTTDTNLSSTRMVKRAFVNEGYNHRMNMKIWYAYILNFFLRDGIYFSLMYPYHELLFPEFKA